MNSFFTSKYILSYIIILCRFLLTKSYNYKFPVLSGDCDLIKCGKHSFCSVHNGDCKHLNSSLYKNNQYSTNTIKNIFNDINIINNNENDDNDCICECKKGYTTPSIDGHYMCCYKQKSSRIAMLLEMFLPIGLGHLYVGNMLLFKIKISFVSFFVLNVVIMGILSCLKRCRKKYESSPFCYKQYRSISLLVFGCIFFVWHVVDSVMFSLRFYKDENGVELE